MKLVKNAFMKIIKWLFSDNTRPIEILSAIILMCFSLIVIFDFADLIKLPTYSSLGMIEYKWPYFLSFAVGLLQICYNIRNKTINFHRRAFLALCASLAYLLMSILFITSSVINTGVSTYFCLSIITLLTSIYIDANE